MMNADAPLASTKHDGLIGELINTYRELNMSVRQIPEERLIAGGAEGSGRSIIARLRLDEMLFAQALKQRVTGVVIGTPEDDERLKAVDSDEYSTTMLISQFGSARETTLSLLRDLSDEDWAVSTDDGRTILQHVEELAKNDQQELQRLKQLLA